MSPMDAKFCIFNKSRYRNMRTSNSNGAGSRSWIVEKSRCSGFIRTFHSPRIAADGTSRATVSPLRIQSSPNLRKDSSSVSCQPSGRVFGSSLPISTACGISPSIKTRSGGLRFGSRFTKVSTAANASEVERKQRARLCCSSDHHRDELTARRVSSVASPTYSPEAHQL